MKKMMFVLPVLAAIFCAVGGCKTKSLERTPDDGRQTKKNGHSRKTNSTGDPLFDAVFRKSRKEADQGGLSSVELSEQERALYNQNRVMRASDDPMVRSLRESQRESKKARNKWVLGTDPNP